MARSHWICSLIHAWTDSRLQKQAKNRLSDSNFSGVKTHWRHAEESCDPAGQTARSHSGLMLIRLVMSLISTKKINQAKGKY